MKFYFVFLGLFILSSGSSAFAGPMDSTKKEAELCAEHSLGMVGIGAMAGVLDTLGRVDFGLAYIVGVAGKTDIDQFDDTRRQGNEWTKDAAGQASHHCAAVYRQTKESASNGVSKVVSSPTGNAVLTAIAASRAY
jgi:hypothetical protein